MSKYTKKEVQRAVDILFGSPETEISMSISNPYTNLIKVIRKPGAKLDFFITNRESDWFISFELVLPTISLVPACQCSEKLDLLQKQLGENDGDMEEAQKEDGPYWARKLAMKFIAKLTRELEPVECKCSSAIRINELYRYIHSVPVKDSLECRGGGSAEQRVSQEISYEEVKYLIRKKGVCHVFRGA